VKVRIKVRPSGLLNGREWPEAGGVIDLPDAVAEGMIASGDAEKLTKAEAEAEEKTEEKTETRPADTSTVEKRGPGRPRKNQG
jgi:hypothetical protein